MGKEYKVLQANDMMDTIAYMIPDVVYASPGGKDLRMTILRPWPAEIPDPPVRKDPLIVFIQGSAFRFPDMYRKIPQLSMFARAGYVVASIEHRSSLEGNPFPAFLEDAKTAVRFLRAHAEEYGIDPDRVAAWGSSSGAATALLLSLTGDQEKYKTKDYAGWSDHVDAVVDCFGPTDLTAIFEALARGEEFPYSDSFKMLAGDRSREQMERIKELSPVYHIRRSARNRFVPTLILHGDQDPTVDYSQSELLYDELSSRGADVALIRVAGALHERNFWSQAVLDEILAFLRRVL